MLRYGFLIDLFFGSFFLIEMGVYVLNGIG